MGKEGQRYATNRTKIKRSCSAEPEDDEIVIDKKSSDNVVQRTRHSAVTEFPLPYVEDGGTAAAETTFSQSEDMLEHLCVDK